MMTDAKEYILRQTALKFYPKAQDVKTGMLPDPWIGFSHDGITCEVHVSRSIPLDNFEEEAWQQFAKLKRDVQLNDVATTPIDTIVISDAEPV
jgi:hypothetical protein